MNWFKTDDIRIQDIEPLISPRHFNQGLSGNH